MKTKGIIALTVLLAALTGSARENAKNELDLLLPDMAPESEKADGVANEPESKEKWYDRTDVAPDTVPEKIYGAAEEITVNVQKADNRVEAVVDKSGRKNNLITVNLNNVPLFEVVQMFARASGMNIVTGVGFDEHVSVNLKEVEWEPALRMILAVADMGMLEKAPGMWVVKTRADIEREPLTVAPIHLRFTTVSNVLPVVESMVSSNGTVSGFSAANVLVVQETFPRLEMIREVIKDIDRPLAQVCIEAKFVELNDQAIKDIGINWSVLQGYTVRAGNLSHSYTHTSRSMNQDALVTSAAGGRSTTANSQNTEQGNTFVNTDYGSSSDSHTSLGGHGYSAYDAQKNEFTLVPQSEQTEITSAILSADEFAVTLSALENNAGVEIVSNPKIVVSSGYKAKIHVGRNEPNIKAYPQGDGGDRYAYALDSKNPFIEIGVKLDVVAVVNTESNINVRISPELSRKLSDKSVGDAGITFPVTQVRRIDTSFNLESGRTVAIGGLTTTEDKEQVIRVPILGRIPILGKYLFSHTHTEKLQDEVIVFVTVKLVSPMTMEEHSGIPSKGKLIHRYITKETLEEAKAEQEAREALEAKDSEDDEDDA